MAHDGDGSPERFQEGFRNRHQKEAGRLRIEIEQLVQQAKVLLHGHEPKSRLPPRPAGTKRAEREREMEATLERANWYRHEIKRLRRDLESWDRVCGGPSNGNGAQERDPMECYNLLAERRKELQKLQRNGQGLDRVAAAQRRAEAEQNQLSPEIQARLRFAKEDVEQQKRLNIRLQADRQRVVAAKKVAEQEVRAANSALRSKAAQLQRPAKPANAASNGDGEPQKLTQLRRDVDIISEAIRQDERKHRAASKDDEQTLEHTRRTVAKLRAEVAGHEGEIARLQAALRSDPSAELYTSGAGASPYEMLSPCAEQHAPDAGELEASPTAAAAAPLGQEAEPEPEIPGSNTPSEAANQAGGWKWKDAQVPGELPPSCPGQEIDAEESDDMAALVAPPQEEQATDAFGFPATDHCQDGDSDA